jgi:hypothetical protein
MLWFGIALLAFLGVFSVFPGDWSESGIAAVRRQRRARRVIAISMAVLVVVFVIIELVSPIPTI